MADLFIERREGGERVILVHIDFYQQTCDGALEEFIHLVNSAGLDSLQLITAKKDKAAPKYFVGLGKAEEIKQAVEAQKAQVVIFNHDLTPAQSRNLEEFFDCRVITRSELILDIFAQRARTYEGKLQVELAQLQHMSTRLVRGWTHLERQKGGIGLRGPGETQLESDRRLVAVRIKAIKKLLEKVIKTRDQGRRARQKSRAASVSLVGYTNAGKSTLFNKMTKSTVMVKDQLFATLDPTLRHYPVAGMGMVMAADTVGFIRDLPHDFVAAFRATLEETQQADLLVHVVDRSASNYEDTIHEVQCVLEDIGADRVPQLIVYNKIDLLPDVVAHIDYDDEQKPVAVWLSAETGEGLPLLADAVGELLSGKQIEKVVRLQSDQAALRSQLYKMQLVTHEEVVDDGWVLTLLVREKEDCYFL